MQVGKRAKWNGLVVACVALTLTACDAGSDEGKEGKEGTAKINAAATPQGAVSSANVVPAITSSTESSDAKGHPVPAAGKATGELSKTELESAQKNVNWADYTGGLPFVIGYEKGVEKMEASGRPAMFFVATSWSDTSKGLGKSLFGKPQVKTLLRNFVCVLVDADSEPQPAGRLGAEGVPAIIFRSTSGEDLASLGGAQTPEAFGRCVARVLKIDS